LQVPTVYVSSNITYHKDHTSFDITWEFEEEFTSTLHQYDTNEDNIFDKEEQLLIEESLVEYINKLHYLTDIEYKHINKLTKPQFIEEITPITTEFEFFGNIIIYRYKFDFPFVLDNRHSLYLGFSDQNFNFNFILQNVILHDYKNRFTVSKENTHAKIKFNAQNLLTAPKADSLLENENSTIQTQEEITKSYIEILSENLTQLKKDLEVLLKDIKETNNIFAYFWLLLFSFLYGILHAIGPGHGKSLVASYFISQDKSYLKALSIASLIGIVHTFSAFVLTLVVFYSVGFIFNSTLVNVEQITTKVSAGVIILIALYLIFKKMKQKEQKFVFSVYDQQSNMLIPKVTHQKTLSCGCNSCKTTATDLGVILAAGIVPCPGTVTIFLFTMSLGIYFVGFLSAIFMSIGMSLIIFITAIISVKIRKFSSSNTLLMKFFEYVSLVFILCLGLFLLLV
ncbi:MAG: hypothetical protein WA945_06625, partial [Arcobacteraceae bacterium]